MAAYEKPTNFWCEWSVTDKEGKVLEPIGFCEFCDKNNTKYYVLNKPCHSSEHKDI
jgi:hypothetical protein